MSALSIIKESVFHVFRKAAIFVFMISGIYAPLNVLMRPEGERIFEPQIIGIMVVSALMIGIVLGMKRIPIRSEERRGGKQC